MLDENADLWSERFKHLGFACHFLAISCIFAKPSAEAPDKAELHVSPSKAKDVPSLSTCRANCTDAVSKDPKRQKGSGSKREALGTPGFRLFLLLI